MVERGITIAVLGGIYLLIFLLLGWPFVREWWRQSLIRKRRLSRRESLLEQRLVSEAISACALERDLASLVRGLGRRCAELCGGEGWVAWLRDRNGEFVPSGAGGAAGSEMLSSDESRSEEFFFAWVLRNPTPMVLEAAAPAFSNPRHAERLQQLLPGLVVPFADGESLVGVLLLGRISDRRARRSEQFLTLYGNFAAILIRKVLLDEEDRRLRRRQQRSESLAALGKLAAGVAHEIRNPLTFIRSAAEQMVEARGDLNDTELSKGMLEEIDRINDRVEELLSLGRAERVEFEPIDLGELLDSAVRLVANRAAEHAVEVRISTGLNGATVLGSGDKLKRLLLNLLRNALEAMPGGGTLTIGVRRGERTAVVEVEDTGVGIPPESVSRVFEPFFTTRESGTGLGLALSYSIARSHGGTLELKRSDQNGTCFVVELPLRDEKPTE